MLDFKQADIELCELVKTDKTNPIIYQKIHDLAFNYLYNVVKPGNSKYDYDVISWDIAGDIFLRIQKGTVISYWTCYISRVINCYYLRQYEKDNWSVVIDTTQDNVLEQNILESCMGVRSSDYSHIEDSLTEIYFSQFYHILNEIMHNTKFKFNSVNRINLQISVLLTLINDKPTYFRISEDLQPFINIIISQIKSHIIQNGIFSREETFENIDLTQLKYADQNENNSNIC